MQDRVPCASLASVMLADRIPQIQEALGEAGLDGWLFACFQNNDPISLELLGLTGDHLITRRCYYLVPREGAPRKLVHRLEPAMLAALPGDERSYLKWQELAVELPFDGSGVRGRVTGTSICGMWRQRSSSAGRERRAGSQDPCRGSTPVPSR